MMNQYSDHKHYFNDLYQWKCCHEVCSLVKWLRIIFQEHKINYKVNRQESKQERPASAITNFLEIEEKRILFIVF